MLSVLLEFYKLKVLLKVRSNITNPSVLVI